MTGRLQLKSYSILLLGASLALAATTDNSFPLMTNCFEDAEHVADVSASDGVRVRYASAAGGVKPCYAVQVIKEGHTLNGFLIGANLPAIQHFEAGIRKDVPQIPPPPPAPVVAKAAATAATAAEPEPEPEVPGPKTLAGLRAADVSGNMIELTALPERNLVVYFWSSTDKKSIQAAEAMESIHGQFAAPRKLEFVSIATGRNLDQYRSVASGLETTWPQIYDKGQLASKYNVNPARPFLVLDRARNVVAAVATPRDLIAELKRLGSK